MSQTVHPAVTPSNIQRIFDTALKSYQKKTKQDLKEHDLFKQFEECDSPGAILAAFQADFVGPSGDEGLKKWIVPTVNVLYAFSATLSQGVALVFSPAQAVFAGVGVLLLAAKDVAASQDILVDLFGRMENFFRRLEICTGVPLTSTMTDKMVEITVEVLDILATATKEIKQSRAKKFVKRVAGRTDLEDGMKKLDKLTLEEVAMASAQLLKVTHDIHNEVTNVANGVDCVDEKVQDIVVKVGDVKCDVQVVGDQVEVVDERVRAIADDGKELMATAMETKSILQLAAENLDVVKRNQMRENLRKWQSAPDPSTSHNFASDRQHEGTADWFITNDKFGEWKIAGSLLWIHGRPGSGKSVLCSAIINDITTLCEGGLASMAYFYFDFRDVNKQARRNLLPSLLVQLAHRSDYFCDILYRLYEAHDNGARQPSDNTLVRCLQEMLALPNQGPVYLIMDALDECPDTSDVPSPREQALDLVKDLVGLRLPSLHICVTSRPEVDISDALVPLASQTVSLQDESGQKKDISDYVRSVVYSGSGKCMKRWRQEDKEHVIETLSGRADGMFRWVFCQLETLRNCLPQNVRRVLKELPKSLDGTYERMLKEIGKVNPHQAYRLLQCLTVATRPLRVEELAEVLAVDFDGAEDGIPALNKDWRWDDEQQGVLSTCSSLIAVVDDTDGFSFCRVVQFAHFSVKEFLTSDRLADLEADLSRFHIRLEPAHTVITQACLAALLQSGSSDKANTISPLYEYAAEHWVDHAQFENVSLFVDAGMRRLFDPSKPYFAGWLKSHNMDEGWYSFLPGHSDTFGYYLDLLREPTFSVEGLAPLCLYHASLCGFTNLATFLISECPQHVNAVVGYNKSPLVAALLHRHWNVAELLYKNGAVVDVTAYQNRTPLHAASEGGIVEIARWLLDHGADPNAQEFDHTTPLHLAATQGHLDLVLTLLEHCVDLNVVKTNTRTPLHEASYHGHVDIVRLLIQHGAEVNTHIQGLLNLASTSGVIETVRLFIELGADVNTPDGTGSHALHPASFRGDIDVIELLFEHGADVNARDGSQQTPLHLALSSYHGPWMPPSNQRVVLLLLQRGAEVNAQDASNVAPLHLATTKANTKVVRLLIKCGADVNARNLGLSTPLHLASSEWNIESVRVLLEHGANVNECDGSHNTPLHMMLSPGIYRWMTLTEGRRVIQLLIEHGANVNARDQNLLTPLHLTSSAGHPRISRLLIEYGADLNARDQVDSTPLHLASSKGDVRTAELLLKLGADPRALDQDHSTPLHLASSSGNSRTVEILLQQGTDVNARDQAHSTPLHLASLRGKAKTVRVLLRYGADVNARDRSRSTPLHLVPFRGDRIAELLLQNGADLHARNQSDSTPLHLAASRGSARNVELLLQHGADFHAQDQGQSTPLHLSAARGSSKAVRILLQHGADVDAFDGRHSTPLHLTVSNQVTVTEVVRLLLEGGANVDLGDDKGQTPFQIASSREQYDIIQLLSEYRTSVG